MQPDLLQQLREVHVPDAPGWWPPAPGWWAVGLVALGLVIMLARLGWRGWRGWQRRRPVRRARALHAELARRRRTGELGDRGYADACNELLKRLVVHGLGIDAARQLADERWLAMLDRALGEPAFTRGPGRILGTARFEPAPEIDAAGLEALMPRLLRALASPPARRLA